jgi:hypothetical protein
MTAVACLQPNAVTSTWGANELSTSSGRLIEVAKVILSFLVPTRVIVAALVTNARVDHPVKLIGGGLCAVRL